MEKMSYNDKLRMQTLREQGLRTKAIISSYPDKGWKLSTVKEVCSRVDCSGSTVLRKPGSARPATASACAVCSDETILSLPYFKTMSVKR